MEIPEYKFAIQPELLDTGDLFLPKRAEPKATGWDVCAFTPDREPLVIRAGHHTKISLGIRSFCPEGWWYELKPRSSTFGKKQLHALYGTIDQTYEGTLLFACQYIPDVRSLGVDLVVQFGEAIGQIIPVKRQEMIVIKISNEEFERQCAERKGVRGTGGFGSSTPERK